MSLYNADINYTKTKRPGNNEYFELKYSNLDRTYFFTLTIY